MKLNPRTGRWEVEWKGEVVAWIIAEVPDEERHWWYRNIVLPRLFGL